MIIGSKSSDFVPKLKVVRSIIRFVAFLKLCVTRLRWRIIKSGSKRPNHRGNT